MELPTWEQFMAPVLTLLSDGVERSGREIKERVHDIAGLSEAQRAVLVSSGGSQADNRIGWATSYLTMATALHRPRRAHYMITEVGRQLLAAHPNGVTEHDLREIPAYVERRAEGAGSRGTSSTPPSSLPSIVETDTALDPVEQIDRGVERIRATVAADLLDRLRGQDPVFLEKSVLQVLVAMGYGGTDGQARHIGGSGDGGVDGVIDQDRLGLQRIYVQAKRYGADNPVGRESIQAFVGALHGQNVTNGIFITTSRFTPNATDYAKSIGTRVVLIDGARLADLMITYGIGVQTTQTYLVVELDEDYFE